MVLAAFNFLLLAVNAAEQALKDTDGVATGWRRREPMLARENYISLCVCVCVCICVCERERL